jgi:predicted RecB family nuclease
MSLPLPLTEEVFEAFLKCRYKAYLKLQGASGEKSDYEQSQARRVASYRAAARETLLQRQPEAAVLDRPASLPEAIRGEAVLITNAVASDAGESCRLDALERVGDKGGRTMAYQPVRFVRGEKVTTADRLLLAFGASVLARIQGTPPTTGKVIHGSQFQASRVDLVSLVGAARDTVGQIRALAEAPKPPPLVLNRHCAECEFRQRCRAAAIEKDDLSLLGGLTAKEIAALNARGIFTVTQYSYTFRPGRMRRVQEKAGWKHDHSLQALALREKTIYVAQRPELPDARARLYLDVEGLPDEGWYYLIGLTIVEGDSRRQLSLWATSEAEEAAIWATFLSVVEPLKDFILFHYGSHESQFLGRMEARHGGEPGLVARIRSRCVNGP